MTNATNELNSLKKSQDVYSDFFNNMLFHPLTGDLAIVKNENSVVNSIKNLLFTNITERPYKYGLGSGIRHVLFEPINGYSANLLKDLIKETIRNYEPRATSVEVDVTTNLDKMFYNVNISFTLINTNEPVSFSVILKKIR